MLRVGVDDTGNDMLAYLAPGLAIRPNQLRVYPGVDWAVVSCLLTAPIPVGPPSPRELCCFIHGPFEATGTRRSADVVTGGVYCSACSRPAPPFWCSTSGVAVQKPRRRLPGPPGVRGLLALLARCISETRLMLSFLMMMECFWHFVLLNHSKSMLRLFDFHDRMVPRPAPLPHAPF